MSNTCASEFTDVPPIVLLADDHDDTLDMYATAFESSGLWVAKANSAAVALSSIADLRPDLMVADIGRDACDEFVGLIRTLKRRRATEDLPIIVLSGDPAQRLPETARRADVCLMKPVVPDDLLFSVRRLIARSHELRARADQIRQRASALIGHSQKLLETSESLSQAGEDEARVCPACGDTLDWLERGKLGGVEYDYYRWCARGCGLYCFDRSARTWVKLA